MCVGKMLLVQDSGYSSALNELFDTSPIEIFADHQLIARPGNRPTKAWLVCRGVVHQYDVKASGELITLNVYKPGAVLSLQWVFHDTDNQFFYEAVGKVELRAVSTELYRRFLQHNPEEAYALLSRLASGMDGLFARVAAISNNDAAIRLLNEMKLEQARFGEIRLTVLELAARSGLARETVSRTLKKLQQDKIIERQGRTITFIKK
jgi:CRP/FNR family transcriptional regulator